jgi:NAD(P)-dependent dehydrogenase (short-subunit alcohol dehydrogenase family)
MSPIASRGKKLVDAAVQTYGRIDAMINNAGLMPQAPLEWLKIDEWDRMIDVNLKGALCGIAAAMPYMQTRKSGHFINVSSVAGHKVGPGFAVYAATNHAVRALSEGLRQELKPSNIRTYGAWWRMNRSDASVSRKRSPLSWYGFAVRPRASWWVMPQRSMAASSLADRV